MDQAFEAGRYVAANCWNYVRPLGLKMAEFYAAEFGKTIRDYYWTLARAVDLGQESDLVQHLRCRFAPTYGLYHVSIKDLSNDMMLAMINEQLQMLTALLEGKDIIKDLEKS